MKQRRFATYAWGVLAYNVLVILWGAYVRATGSGAGCGRHWPTCNGQAIPRAPEIETIVEFSHRVSSGLAGVFVLFLFFWAWRRFPRGHLVRKGAAFSLLFIITEGAVGAGLVLFEWVAYNASVERVFSSSLHLVNTFLLLAALTVTAWWASNFRSDARQWTLRVRGRGAQSWLLSIALLLLIVVSAAGAVTALGDTLFPPESLGAGIARDFSPLAHFTERLRIWHPILAVLTSFYIFTILGLVVGQDPGPRVRRLMRLVQILVGVQLFAGIINVLLLAPVFMQMVHLLLADTVWVSLILLAATLWVEAREEVPEEKDARAFSAPAPSGSTD